MAWNGGWRLVGHLANASLVRAPRPGGALAVCFFSNNSSPFGERDMSTRMPRILAGGVIAALTIGVLYARDPQNPKSSPASRPGDEDAIRATARDFAAAFNKGDANAIAAQWTENGECIDADGTMVRGRADIEQAFGEYFKEHPKTKIEVLIRSIRFPAPDLAVEEGILRQAGGGKELPATSLYSVTHVRTGGRWLAAVSREWGAGQDRLEDLDWLVGQWKATVKDQEVTLTFTRDGEKPFIVGKFTRRSGSKPPESGTMQIGLDPQTGQLRAWHFDEGGGHGQSLWVRDGTNWVQDAIGVLGDGTETASVNILGRVNPNEITWRSIDRVIGGQALPDTVPIRLSRVAAAK
jgi:uncharacterized protein (TIGR02246 family)